MIVKKFTKRMRCSVQGCRVHASYGLGTKGIDYPVCEMHFKELIEDGNDILLAEKEELYRVKTEVKEQPEEAEVAQEETNEEFFECKYCHEKFFKSQYTLTQFATHTKQCKRAHT